MKAPSPVAKALLNFRTEVTEDLKPSVDSEEEFTAKLANVIAGKDTSPKFPSLKIAVRNADTSPKIFNRTTMHQGNVNHDGVGLLSICGRRSILSRRPILRQRSGRLSEQDFIEECQKYGFQAGLEVGCTTSLHIPSPINHAIPKNVNKVDAMLKQGLG